MTASRNQFTQDQLKQSIPVNSVTSEQSTPVNFRSSEPPVNSAIVNSAHLAPSNRHKDDLIG
eukprot:4699048-Amphidinium_carterae.1